MSDIMVSELECKVYLLENIEYKYMKSNVTSFIDTALCSNDDIQKFHKDDKTFKNYTYSGFVEIERDKKYKQGNIYSFKIRSTDSRLTNYLKSQLPQTTSNAIKGLVCTSRVIPRRFITKLYSITQVNVASDKGYWKNIMNLITEYERLI